MPTYQRRCAVPADRAQVLNAPFRAQPPLFTSKAGLSVSGVLKDEEQAVNPGRNPVVNVKN